MSKYDREAQKWISEDAVRKSMDWDFECEEKLDAEFIKLCKSNAVKAIVSSIVIAAGLGALFFINVSVR